MGVQVKPATIELCTQRSEWRCRILAAVINGTFDAETIADLLDAGWAQAHTEGLQDASGICQDVANAVHHPVQRRTAQKLADACLELIALNQATNQ